MTQEQAADAIREAFRYWEQVPPLVPLFSLDELARRYSRQAHAHWFDRDTLRWFGSTGRRMVRPGLVVECQRNAPGDRYAVTAFVLDGDRIAPQLVGLGTGAFATAPAAA